MQLLPWDVSEQLTEERLRLLAATIDHVRDDALESHDTDKGDTNWGLGCKGYERTCHAFGKLTLVQAKDWLTVERNQQECTIRVGGVPIKFYRGEASDPKPRALRGGERIAVRDAMRGQTSLLDLFAPEFRAPESEWFWLMAIEVGADNTVARVVVLQATSAGDMRNDWSIPLDVGVATVAEVTDIRREGVDLAPPLVGPKEAEITELAAGDDDDVIDDSES